MQQTKIVHKGELFYVPRKRQREQEYSQNFVKLFKTALKKAYHCKPKLSNVIRQDPKAKEQATRHLPFKVNLINNLKKRTSASVNNQSIRDMYSQKLSNPQKVNNPQKLMKQITKGRKCLQTAQIEEQLRLKRCRTIATNQVEYCSNSLDEDRGRYRMPLKLRYSQTINQRRKRQRLESLPPLMRGYYLSQQGQAVQIVDKYHQMQARYRSKQFLSVPIEISSLYTQDNRMPLIQTKAPTYQIQKITKESLVRSKNKHIKCALAGISRKNKTAPQNSQLQEIQNNRKLQYLVQEKVQDQFWKVRQKKLINKRSQHINSHIANKHLKTQLNQKQPLDQYFKPWEDEQSTGGQKHYCINDLFNKSRLEQNILASQNGQ